MEVDSEDNRHSIHSFTGEISHQQDHRSKLHWVFSSAQFQNTPLLISTSVQLTCMTILTMLQTHRKMQSNLDSPVNVNVQPPCKQV